MLSRVKRFFQRNQTAPVRKSHKQAYTRLHIDVLEGRVVPATASGVISGMAFVDTNANGVFDASDAPIAGVTVTLNGTTTQEISVSDITTITDHTGAYRFNNVLPGTYSVDTSGSDALLNGTNAITVVGGNPVSAAISGSENLTRNLAVTLSGQLPTPSISLLLFMNTSPYVGSRLGTAGGGNALANFRANNTPTISNPFANLTVGPNAANSLFKLAGRFTDVDYTNSRVTFKITADGEQHTIAVELFDKQTPQTVANFFNYVLSNKYDNSIFHRLAANFVLQGGAVKLNAAGDNLELINTGGFTVPNEFFHSNVAGTLAMALSGGDINSATDQFFFNLKNNGTGTTSDLDDKDFTVFGRIADSASFATLLDLATTPTQNLGSRPIATTFPTTTFAEVPLNDYAGSQFPNDATADNYLVVNDITVDKRDEFLTYAVSVDVTSGPSNLVTATLVNEQLALSYPSGQTGTATVTVTATDRYGATMSTSFNVTVA